MKYLVSILSVTLITFNLFSQYTDTTKTIIDKTKIQIKLSDGKHKFYQYNYRASIISFKEVLAIDNDNAKANFGIAQCEYAMKNFNKAKDYAIKAYYTNKEVDPDILYLMGNIYHRIGELKLAEEFISKFKAGAKESTIKEYDVDLILSQIKYATTATNENNNAKITNMGDNINTSAQNLLHVFLKMVILWYLHLEGPTQKVVQ